MPKLSPITQDLILRSKAYQQGMDDANKKLRRFQKQSKGVKGDVKALGGSIKTLGSSMLALAGVGGLGSLAMSSINLGSQISDLSEQLRINATSLQTLNAVALKAGLDQSSLERAIRNVSLRTQEALDGNTNYADAIERLGLNLEDFARLPTEQKLETIAKAYAAAGKSQEAFADVSQILGQRAGPKMLEVLRRLNDEGLESLTQGAIRSGQVMGPEVIDKMDRAADEIGKAQLQLKILGANILSKAIPAFKIFGDGIGFVGDMLGVSLLNAKAFFDFLVRGTTIAIQPTIKQFQALGVAAEAALTFNPKKKFELIKEAAALQKEALSDLTDVPSQIATAFEEMTKDVKYNSSTLETDILRRSKNMLKNWGDLTGQSTSAASSSGGGSSTSTAVSPQSRVASVRIGNMGAAAQGPPPGEGRVEFLRRQEQERRDHIAGTLGLASGKAVSTATAATTTAQGGQSNRSSEIIDLLQRIADEFTKEATV